MGDEHFPGYAHLVIFDGDEINSGCKMRNAHRWPKIATICCPSAL
jgi:hypothetical protein